MNIPFIGEVGRISEPVKAIEAPKEKDIAVGSLSFEVFGLGNQDQLTTKSAKLLRAYDGWVYANVKAIAHKVSEMELKLYQANYSKGEIVYEEINQHPLLELLDQFNPFTTSNDAYFLLDAHLMLAGDTFVYKERNGGKIENLFILDPTKITVIPGDANDGYIVTKYEYKDTVEGKPITVDYDPADIVPFKEPNPSNPYRGKSIVEAAAQTIDTDTMAGEYNKNFFKNSAIPNSVMRTDQRMSKDDIDRVERDLRRNFGGFSKAHKTMILSGGLDFSTIATTQKDMEFLAQQQWTRDKIMAIFGNTKTSLGIVEDVNRANADASIYSWLKHNIKPRMKRIVNTFNEYLVPEYGDNLILGYEDPVPDDRDALTDEAVKLVSNSIITVNEAREILELEPTPGGDELIQAANPITTETSQ